MVTPTPNVLSTYCYFGILLLLGIVLFIITIFVAIVVLVPRLDVMIPMPIIDIVESGYDLITRLIKGTCTILDRLIKVAFAILYLIIVLWALLIVIWVGYNILVIAFNQMHPHIP